MNTLPYTQAEYDAFGWSTMANSSLPLCETHGMEYDSAVDATPRLFGVSFGNGNDGVSHTWPNYLVRCTAYKLAAAAMIGDFRASEDQQFAADNVEVDGEADYTIYATIYNPPDDDDDESEDDDAEMWCNVNGAWAICEVFPYDREMTAEELAEAEDCGFIEIDGRPAYASLEDAISADVLAMADQV